MKLSEDIRKDLESARVFLEFANRETIKLWNSMRGAKEPPAFGGWYWLHGYREGGPFRCESAAMRDAWYRVCLRQEPPLMNSTREMKAALQRRHPPHLRFVS